MADQLLWKGGENDSVSYLQIDRKNLGRNDLDLGDAVRIKNGKYQGTEGVVCEFDRETVTLECERVAQKK